MIDVIAPNVIIDTEGFGDFDKNSLYGILRDIMNDISFYNPKIIQLPLRIIKSELGYPKNNTIYLPAFNQKMNIMRIDADGNDFTEWIGQFAHEYVHYLIGSVSTEQPKLLWFHETICQLSSYLMLQRTRNGHFDSILGKYASQTKEELMGLNSYIFHCQREKQEYIRQELSHGDGETFLNSLSHEPEDYIPMASLLYPSVGENPDFWRIVTPLAEMPRNLGINDILTFLLQWPDEKEKLGPLIQNFYNILLP